MRVVLVHGAYFNSWEALGLGYIGAYLRKHVPNVDLRFFQGCFDDRSLIVYASCGADVVAFSATSPTYAWCRDVAKQIKEASPHTLTVIGGYHASAVPQDCTDFDYVVCGEGEQAMSSILGQGPIEPGAKLRITYGPRSILSWPDLPWPDRKLIKCERNIAVAQKDTGKRITSFQAHRGCPYHCIFCADGQRVLGRHDMIHRPVGDLLDEMQSVAEEYRLDFARFCDATWNVDKRWVKEFCHGKIKRDFRLPFFADLHAGPVDAEMMSLMREAGCEAVGIGVESGASEILRSCGKGTTRKMIYKARLLAHRAGIKVRGYFLIGLPGETNETLLDTEEFAAGLDLDEYSFTLFCPYPGTAVYKADPARFKDVAWGTTDECSNDFWLTEALTNAELKAWQTRLVAKFRDKATWHHRVLGRNASNVPNPD